MTRVWTRRCAALLLVTLAAAGCGQGSSVPGTMTIAVIPKGTSHVFWQSVHAGAQKAASELGIEIIWRGPLREDDRDSQVSEVEGFVSRGISGIVLAPLDEAALTAVADQSASPKYVICNADESEPGTFKDRVIMERDPFSVVEALTIAGLATGDLQAYFDTELAWRSAYIGYRELVPFTAWFQSGEWWLGQPMGTIAVIALILAFGAFLAAPAVGRL